MKVTKSCSSVFLPYPEAGKKKMMELWFASDDRAVLWVVKESLRKKRLS